MPDTEPVRVVLEADPSDLVTGLNAGKEALRGFGEEARTTGDHTFTLVGRSQNLFRTMLILRGATGAVETVMKRLGVSTKDSSAILETLNTIMTIGITVLAVYRAALAIKAAMHWIAARAAAAEAIAEGGILIPFVGAGIVASAILGAWALSEAFAPRAQFGGMFPARPGGTVVRVAEAGRPEAVIPFHRGALGGGDVTVNMNIYTNDPDELVRALGRRIQTLRQAGY